MDITSKKGLYSKQILVVDDDPTVGALIKRVLKHDDFENVSLVTTAESALVALNISIGDASSFYVHCPFDIIILDIALPDMNGFDLCKRIKSVFCGVPILLVSGYDIRDIQSKVLACGADDFMSKPFNSVEMVTRVNLLLSRSDAFLDSDTVFDINNSQKINHSVPVNQIPYIGSEVGNYVIIDCIGLGKTSIIYKVIDLKSHQILAMKMLTGHSNDFREIVKRFEFEIRIMSMIDHPNVIKFYDKGEFKGSLYLVMEYLDGVNLEELMIARGRISQKLLLDISLSIGNALHQIHSKGIIHRDIKLKNSIYIPLTGEVKLCDFGIAQLPDVERITHDGTIIGTPIYMAPEALRGSDATVASDIFSFGATVYHLATNTPPFIANSPSELYRKQMENPPTPITEIREDFVRNWDDLVIDKCLSFAPDKRPRSMAKVVEMLKEIGPAIDSRRNSLLFDIAR